MEPQVTCASYLVYHQPLCRADIIDERILNDDFKGVSGRCGYVVMNRHVDCQIVLPHYKRICARFCKFKS
ncbi:hypothetical protein CPB83DRAFT_858850 [Crepidotus variabilis]|uniref:Uncharacterized protein n=1 Tax=Crepidotus variabilis TaxID=179855 RepID=A0A9P6EB89_9AGAR|nr:hypothetical protein CPB83DRAFT_858850 [Crepidotus variabilis]